MAIFLLMCKFSLLKELFAEQVEVICGLILREGIWVKFPLILRSSNAILDHLTHQILAIAKDLVIWAIEEEETTSAMVQAVSAVEAYWSCGRFATMDAKLPMICEDCFHSNFKKGYSDPIGDNPLLHFFHTHYHLSGALPRMITRAMELSNDFALKDRLLLKSSA